MVDNNWKKHLLSSGTPLEFETARTLASAGFYVNADYEYIRHDGAVDKEFSVDISASYYRSTRMNFAYSIEMLIECKYRSREKLILFYEDPNNRDYSGAIAGYTIPYIDQFCPFHLSGSPIYELEFLYPFVYKGIEIFDKGANEKDFKHACQQLKFAAPDLLSQTLTNMLSEHEDERCPRFLTRLLVSNAPLRVLKPGLTIQSIEQSKSIEAISNEVPAVVLMSGVGPELKAHYKKVLSSLSFEQQRIELETIEYSLRRRGKHTEYSRNRPSEFFRNMVDMDWASQKFLKQFFVVNAEHLPLFIKRLKDACAKSYKMRKKSDKTRKVGRR